MQLVHSAPRIRPNLQPVAAPRASLPKLSIVRDDEIAETISSAPPAPAVTTSSDRAETFARHLLTAIRVAMGLMFMVCGLNGLFDFLPHADGHMPHGALALGGALVLAGSAFPLLKGAEVIVSTLLELYQSAHHANSAAQRALQPPM